jgi:hypothetical protein
MERSAPIIQQPCSRLLSREHVGELSFVMCATWKGDVSEGEVQECGYLMCRQADHPPAEAEG